MSQGVVIRRFLGVSRILPEFPVVSVFRYASKNNLPTRPFRKETNKNKELTHTTVMVQDRLDIQEVPTIVRKIKSADVIGNADTENKDQLTVTSQEGSARSGVEDVAILDDLLKCNDLKYMYNVIATLPENELSSHIVLRALQRIIEVENNVAFRNVLLRSNNSLKPARLHSLNKLLNFVVSCPDNSVLLESLATIIRDSAGTWDSSYMDKLVNETLIRANDRKFSVSQMCEIVHLLSALKSEHMPRVVDELWTGFIDRGKEINENNIGELFQVLPLLKESQKMIYNMLKRKCEELWWRLPSTSVVEILSSLHNIKFSSNHTLSLLSRNTSTNINSLTEEEIQQIISGFHACDYVDENIEEVLDKYMKAKGSNMRNVSLLEMLLQYCTKCRLRFKSVLDASANFLIAHNNYFTPVQFKSFLFPLGYFHYSPSNNVKFWQAVENFMLDKFIQFRPDDIIDVAITCVYLEKYPLNLTAKILNPYFLDRMHSCKSGVELQHLRTKLKVFDCAMALECPQYQGPFLPRDYAVKSIPQDERIKRMIKQVFDVVVEVVETSERVSTSVLMPQLPATNLYIVDIMLHPAGMEPLVSKINSSSDQDMLIAILIHPPEHFCSKEEYLIGPQVMKKRHLKKLGISVVDLKYSDLVKMKGKKQEIQKYLNDKIGLRELSVT